jgi:septal ring factor EnvC (AmiA/AmiB activator)
MTDETLVKQALAELGDIVRCHCDEACISRGLHDPSCNCDSSEALATVKKHIRKLTEQLEAARADAKEAEAYADELAEDQVDLCRQLIAAEDKLAKVMEAASPLLNMDVWTESAEDAETVIVSVGTVRRIRATLAELEGDK